MLWGPGIAIPSWVYTLPVPPHTHTHTRTHAHTQKYMCAALAHSEPPPYRSSAVKVDSIQGTARHRPHSRCQTVLPYTAGHHATLFFLIAPSSYLLFPLLTSCSLSLPLAPCSYLLFPLLTYCSLFLPLVPCSYPLFPLVLQYPMTTGPYYYPQFQGTPLIGPNGMPNK